MKALCILAISLVFCTARQYTAVAQGLYFPDPVIVQQPPVRLQVAPQQYQQPQTYSIPQQQVAPQPYYQQPMAPQQMITPRQAPSLSGFQTITALRWGLFHRRLIPTQILIPMSAGSLQSPSARVTDITP